MDFKITSPSQIIKIDLVYAGCDQIDASFDNHINATNAITKASGLLGKNSIQFGEGGKTTNDFSEQLSVITGHMENFQVTNEGITTRIRKEAQLQYEAEWAEYRRYLASLEEKQSLEMQQKQEMVEN